MAHGGSTIGKDLEPRGYGVRDAQLLQNFRNMNSGGGCLDVGNEDRVGGKKRVAQRRGVADRYLGITGADGHRRLDQADIGYRSADDKIIAGQIRNLGRRQHDDVGRRAGPQFVGHRADRAELAFDVEAGQRLELRRKARDQALRFSAAENVQRGHRFESIGAKNSGLMLCITEMWLRSRSRSRWNSIAPLAPEGSWIAIAARMASCSAITSAMCSSCGNVSMR